MPPRAVFERYFSPQRVSAGRSVAPGKLSGFAASWFAGKLVDFGEPPLAPHAARAGACVYRVLEFPALAFTGDYVIRVDGEPPRAAVETKRSVRCKVGRTQRLETVAERRTVGSAVWDGIAKCMRRGFWSAPLRDSVTGMDGWETVFEGVCNGRYHLVERWTLTDSDPLPARRALARCRALVRAAAGLPARDPVQ